MPVDGADAELAHAPGLGAQLLDHHRPLRNDVSIKRLDVVEFDVSEVRVIAEFRGWQRAAAFAGHDEAPVSHEKAPAGVFDLSDFETQHVPVKRRRTLQVVHSDYVSRL